MTDAHAQPWHSERDMPDRRRMMSEIINLYEKTRPTLVERWRDRLPSFLQRLEEALYRGSCSKEEYCNTATLDDRLKRATCELLEGLRSSKPSATLDASETVPPSVAEVVFVNSPPMPHLAAASWVYRG
jgi:hypothetical protein